LGPPYADPFICSSCSAHSLSLVVIITDYTLLGTAVTFEKKKIRGTWNGSQTGSCIPILFSLLSKLTIWECPRINLLTLRLYLSLGTLKLLYRINLIPYLNSWSSIFSCLKVHKREKFFVSVFEFITIL
jgi:hypothetical protein